MKVTKQQKILGGVMVIGLCLVVADQLGWLPGASKPVAVETPAEYAVAETPPAATVAAPVVAAAAPAGSVAHRLRVAARSCSGTRLHDAFAPGSVWMAQAPAAPAPLADNSVDVFRQAHRLTGVLSGSGRGEHAMVDGKIVSVGQSIDGFRLVNISHRSAVFESGAGQVTLNMTERGAGSTVANIAP